MVQQQQKILQIFQLNDYNDLILNFLLPNNSYKIEFELKCEIELNDLSIKNFYKSQAFTVNLIDQTKGIATPHLIPTNEENKYQISILGKNGEGIDSCPCEIELTHSYLSHPLTYQLQSNQKRNNFITKIGWY